jgi:hypothetical protein
VLGVSLKGTTVSVTVDGQAVVGYVFNAATVDGRFGLLATSGAASFDDVRVKTDDPAFLPGANSSNSTNSAPALADVSPQVAQVIRLDATLRAREADPWRLYPIADPASGQTLQPPGNPPLITRARAARDLVLSQPLDLRTATSLQYIDTFYKSRSALRDTSSSGGEEVLFKDYKQTVGEALLLEVNGRSLNAFFT